MRYKIYKLKFNTFLHSGIDKGNHGLENTKTTINSDTFFSALCNEIIKIYGQETLNVFVEKTRQGELVISDLLPFINEELYVPKPAFSIQKTKVTANNESVDRKKLKSIEFISISELDDYVKSMREGKRFIPKSFDSAKKEVLWKNSIDEEDGAEPYVVAGVSYEKAVSFDKEEQEDTKKNNHKTVAKNAGLYFILGISGDLDIDFDQLVESLSFSGVGGKRSAGLGKFEEFEEPIEVFLDDDYYLYESDRVLKEKLLAKGSNYHLLISTLIPDKSEIEELKEGRYMLLKRGGFVFSQTYSDTQVKKKSIIAVASGSVFKRKIEGTIKDLSNGGNHPVYRFGKGLYLGVKIDELKWFFELRNCY